MELARILDTVTMGPARRRRHMLKVLAQLDRQDEIARLRGQDPLQAWAPPPGGAPVVELRPRRHRASALRVKDRSRFVTIAVILVIVAVVVVSILNRNGALFGGSSASPATGSTYPPAGVGEHSHPLGSPPPAPAGTGGYAFEATQPGSALPVTWDPCRAIHYVVEGTPPPGDGQVVQQAVARMSEATGFQFVYDGKTSERLTSAERDPYQPGRYGKRWAPLIIDWSNPSAEPDLAGGTIGLGKADAVTLNGHATYVTGEVALDTPQLTQVANAGQPAMVKAVVLHELGHALGLAHVTDPNEIMYPETQLKVTDLGPGDLRGLALLGQGNCAPGI